ncbi:hypothetical protein [Halococcus sp. IIIV-5B]|uniref:hypothetical protein n=1 Tax=Halococcus sp. IIIV-5B TaxID=2321230 RepID=UPI0011C44E51|nr:hypothetical protein [Halococcus sp. IIIV-5B]
MSTETTWVSRDIPAGETVREAYQLYGDDIYATGTYYLTVWSGLRPNQYRENGEWSKIPLNVAMDVTRRKRLPI